MKKSLGKGWVGFAVDPHRPCFSRLAVGLGFPFSGDLDEPEPEVPDLLQQMAQKDKELLGLKTEAGVAFVSKKFWTFGAAVQRSHLIPNVLAKYLACRSWSVQVEESPAPVVETGVGSLSETWVV